MRDARCSPKYMSYMTKFIGGQELETIFIQELFD